jgi:PHD/YefM family antitoxin component YafN of YafNO toxin-antitoxin module
MLQDIIITKTTKSELVFLSDSDFNFMNVVEKINIPTPVEMAISATLKWH